MSKIRPTLVEPDRWPRCPRPKDFEDTHSVLLNELYRAQGHLNEASFLTHLESVKELRVTNQTSNVYMQLCNLIDSLIGKET